MNKFIGQHSVILDDYESHKSVSFECYESGVVVKQRQDQVNKGRGIDPKYSSAQIVSYLKKDEAIKLRDYLLTHYPVEAAK